MNQLRQKNMEVLFILGICLAIIGLSIAYAILTVKLSIKGTAKLSSSYLEIHFEDVTASTVGNASYTLPVISSKTVLTNFQIELMSPGDSVTFEFKIINNEEKNAKVSSIVKSIPKCKGNTKKDEELICSNLIYKITKEDGTELKEGEPILKNSSNIIKLTVGYPLAMQDIPSKQVLVENLDIDLLFTEKNF